MMIATAYRDLRWMELYEDAGGPSPIAKPRQGMARRGLAGDERR
jgi:hypothetical protein